MFLDEFVGHAFGFPDCHPPVLGLRSWPLDYRLRLFGFWLVFLVFGGLRTG